MGFDVGMHADKDFERAKSHILDEMKRTFKPEFINRINEIVVFQPLTHVHMGQIVDLELGKVSKRLADQNIVLSVQPAAKEFLIEKGYDEKLGARPLKRAVEKYIEDALAEAILRGDVKRGVPVLVDRKNEEELSFVSGQKKGAPPPAAMAGNGI
jgi:ATP-dependent Clp protease ATP-binding subunit ClpC